MNPYDYRGELVAAARRAFGNGEIIAIMQDDWFVFPQLGGDWVALRDTNFNTPYWDNHRALVEELLLANARCREGVALGYRNGKLRGVRFDAHPEDD